MSKKPNTKGGRLSSPRKQAEEFGGAKKGLVICENCDIYNFKKGWHHDADSFIAKRENKDIQVHFALCPACHMIKNRQYEGKLVVNNIPAPQKKDLMNMIKGYCDRAFSQDPLDRLIGVVSESSSLIVTVTKKQLAQRLAKKIKDAFNKVKISNPNFREPGDVANITVEFLAD